MVVDLVQQEISFSRQNDNYRTNSRVGPALYRYFYDFRSDIFYKSIRPPSRGCRGRPSAHSEPPAAQHGELLPDL